MELLKVDCTNEKVHIKKRNKVLKLSFDPLYLSITDTEISCGVFQVAGLNLLAEEVNSLCVRNKLPKKLQYSILKQCIKASVKYDMNDEEYNGAMWLFSTNLTNNKHKNLIERVMGDLSSTKSRSRKNPNSGNKIRVWIIPNSNL